MTLNFVGPCLIFNHLLRWCFCMLCMFFCQFYFWRFRKMVSDSVNICISITGLFDLFSNMQIKNMHLQVRSAFLKLLLEWFDINILKPYLDIDTWFIWSITLLTIILDFPNERKEKNVSQSTKRLLCGVRRRWGFGAGSNSKI